MTSATALSPRSDAPPAPASRGSRSRGVAATLSVAGSAVAFLIAGLGLLTAPVAALLVFGPALFDLM
ncbi:hypothetical protein [Microbacterium invictum]|uniref:Uncharacterized protein n=1 Tax=Microbacterium invictum TaxID=515415 RepID=A0AA40SP38_9MICO|nr:MULTISPECIES: hypothetical protein [Microbacterium]MBB4139662.1 hypothetical protein [Microbacterium invictum]